MFNKNYYCLVASLREYTLEADKKGFDARAVIDEIREELNKSDRNALELFYGYYDIENIIGLKAGRSRVNVLGNFSREELEQQLARPTALPSYMAEVLRAYADPENEEAVGRVDLSLPIEHNLFTAYYKACAESGCGYLRAWAEFDRTLRNVCAAYAARRSGKDVDNVVVGGGVIADALMRSSAADFGLKGEVDYLDEVMAAVADEQNLVEKERKIDRIRWSMSDTLAEKDYFNINTILSYLSKLNIVQRWFSLDERVGRAMYDELIASLSGREVVSKAIENI
ncbi:MAG: DUF2764 family protein [Rikenellaceae bacterium]|nr:DUF2764 family protein [Rikenellaceae bacterium]